MIKIMKPQDHMTYEMIDIARKASQQVMHDHYFSHKLSEDS
jgi:hypothetical protein